MKLATIASFWGTIVLTLFASFASAEEVPEKWYNSDCPECCCAGYEFDITGEVVYVKVKRDHRGKPIQAKLRVLYGCALEQTMYGMANWDDVQSHNTKWDILDTPEIRKGGRCVRVRGVVARTNRDRNGFGMYRARHLVKYIELVPCAERD